MANKKIQISHSNKYPTKVTGPVVGQAGPEEPHVELKKTGPAKTERLGLMDTQGSPTNAVRVEGDKKKRQAKAVKNS